MRAVNANFQWAAVLVVCWLAVAGSAPADTIYTATLNDDLTGTGSAATGLATLILNEAGTEVSYVIEMTGLAGEETGAHIHNGGPGLVGARLHILPLGTPKVGIWSVNAYEVTEMNAGRVYINIHTTSFTTGEVGGTVEFVTVANAAVAWSAVKVLYR